MERLPRKRWRVRYGLVVIRLGIFIITCGLAELSAQQPSTTPFSPRSDTHAFLQDRPEVPNRTRAHHGRVSWLMVAILGLLWAVAYHLFFSLSTPAEAADVESSWHSLREPAVTLAE